MARLVTGIGVPHTPFFPGIAKQQGDSSRMVQLFKRVRQELESAKPDLIVMLTTDHFVSFFFDNMPTFCVGAFEHARWSARVVTHDATIPAAGIGRVRRWPGQVWNLEQF
jgi:hypothetical protein